MSRLKSVNSGLVSSGTKSITDRAVLLTAARTELSFMSAIALEDIEM